MTVKFRMASAPKTAPQVSWTHTGASGSPYGSWLLGVPLGGGIGDLPAKPGTGTLTLVDNTVPRKPADGHDCGSSGKADCGTSSLTSAQTLIEGYDRRRLVADLRVVEFQRKGGHGRRLDCRIGESTIFSDGILSGGTRKGELLLRMPRPSKLAHSRVVRVTGVTHKRTAYSDCGSGAPCTDDITRRVTVTFRHL